MEEDIIRKALVANPTVDPKALEKQPKDTKGTNGPFAQDESINNEIIGFFINFGVTTCRLFEVLKDQKGLNERISISYDISDPQNPKYLRGIIEHVKNEILPNINKSQNQIFLKTFADACFSDVFPNENKRNSFIMDFYNETSLYFNILSQKQTSENLRRLFKNIGSGTAIINIGSQYVDILVQQGNRFQMYNLKLTLNDISNYIKKHAIPERWDESIINSLKRYIAKKIRPELEGIVSKSVVIIKDELKFMRDLGYPLMFDEGCNCLSIEDYKQANREFLFCIDYQKEVETKNSDISAIKRLYGFKNGHIILETIFDCLGTETVIPSDELSIHGSLNAYIFNVVISGSSNGERADYMVEAHKLMTEMGATVLSPRIINGQLSKQTHATDVKHASAIRDCDLLFVCNKDGYIGKQTGREIYGAYLLNKPIAFWREPEDDERLDFIPHEQWWSLMKYLENDENHF